MEASSRPATTIPGADVGRAVVDASPEAAQASLQADLEQQHAWAVEQLKFHESAVRAARTIINGCESALQTMAQKDPTPAERLP